MQDGCRVYMASNGACFMVTWAIFKNHLLEVGLTQNWETMALEMLTTVDLFYFIMCEFEKRPVKVRDFKKITHRCRGIYGKCCKSIKKNCKDVNM
jgi:hypothetical protein